MVEDYIMLSLGCIVFIVGIFLFCSKIFMYKKVRRTVYIPVLANLVRIEESTRYSDRLERMVTCHYAYMVYYIEGKVYHYKMFIDSHEQLQKIKREQQTELYVELLVPDKVIEPSVYEKHMSLMDFIPLVIAILLFWGIYIWMFSVYLVQYGLPWLR